MKKRISLLNKKFNAGLFCLGSFIFMTSMAFAQFTPGNIVVLQAGDGTSALANTGNPILFKEYSPSGVPAFSLSIPATSTINALVIGGSATSEGGLSLSPNGRFLVFAGYVAALPYSSSLSGSTGSAVKRGIGVVGMSGLYSRVAALPYYSGDNIRSATSDGLNNYWAAGSSNGTCYFGVISPSVVVQNSVTNTKYVSVFGGNVYCSTGVGTQGIYMVGSGSPTIAGQSASLVINTASTGSGMASPVAFFFNPTQSICYIADDRTPANGGGIQKWVNNGSAWSLAYTLATGTVAYGARGVVADFSGTNPKIFAITSEGSLNRLVAINDVGAASTATLLAAATASTIFRGIAFSPYCIAPQPPNIASLGPVCATRAFTLDSYTGATGPLSYTWTGPGGFYSSVANPTLIATQSGSYSLSIANGCGSGVASASIIVNPLPVISVSGSTICPGGIATLTASGAYDYGWAMGANGSTMAVSPTVSTSYPFIAISVNNCTVQGLGQVIVVNSLNISINSATTCMGTAATLTTSGATSFIWSTGATSSGITVAPANTTVYTATGTASGCTAAATATAMVTVYSVPLVTVSSSTICTGSTATLTASGAATYSWNALGTASVVNTSPTVTTVYSVTGTSSLGCMTSALSTVVVNASPVVVLGLVNPMCTNGPAINLVGVPAGGVYAGAGVNGNLFNPAVPGTFTVSYTFTDNNNCAATSSRMFTVSDCTGMSEIITAGNIQIYPNPVRYQLNIRAGDFTKPFTVEVYRANGEMINEISSAGTFVLLDVTGLQPGMYLLRLKNGAARDFVKFIKE